MYYIRKLNEVANKYADKTGYSPAYLKVSYLFNLALYRMSIGEFFKLGHYKHNMHEKLQYLGLRNDVKLRLKKLNTPQTREILGDKRKTIEKYNEFVKRKYFFYGGQADNQKLTSFLENTDDIIVKPTGSYAGNGVRRVDVSTVQKKEDFIKEVTRQGECLIEERIFNHDKINELSPDCLNTVRLYTALDRENKMHVLACCIRMGTGGYLDNAAQGGIFAPIDYETGIITKSAANYLGDEFCFHPVSNIKTPGFYMPNWDLFKKTVDKLLQIMPEARYVGWDIAVTNDGIEIIEGNADAGTDLLQIIAERGLLKELKNCV